MVAVTVEVDGTGLMDDIGAVNIYVYRSTDNEHFYYLRTFSYEDFPAMMTHNAYYYSKTPITFQGVAGCYYYANVDVYAAKDGSAVQHADLYDECSPGRKLNRVVQNFTRAGMMVLPCLPLAFPAAYMCC